MTFYNRGGILYARYSGGKRISTKLEYSKENIKLFKSYAQNKEFFKKFDVIKTSPTVIELCEEVLKEKEKTLKATSYKSYESLLKSRIIPFFGNKKIVDIKPIHISDFYKTFEDRNTLSTCECLLKPAFEKAILMEIISTTPFIIKKPKIKSSGYEINPFNMEEVQKIIDYNDKIIGNFLAIACLTGLRTGELCGLRWSDVNLKDMTISINQQFTHGFLQSPKTKKSKATIDLPIEALPFFEKQRLKTGLREYIFYSAQGKEPWKYSSHISLLFKKILKKLDIKDRGIYQTRHTFASIRLTMGEKVEWVSYMLRHENINITLSKYYKYIRELDTKRVTLNFDLTHNQHTS